MEENWHEQTVKGALRAEASKSGHCVVEPSAFMGGMDAICPSAACFKGSMGAKAGNIGYTIEGAPTLVAGQETHTVYALQGNGIDRDVRQNGGGFAEGCAYTLNTTDRHGVVYPETARTLTAEHDGSWCVDKGPNVVCYGVDCRNGTLDREKTHTIQGKGSGNGTSLNCTPSVCYRKSVKPSNNEDYERWIEDGKTNTLNTFEYSDVRTTEAIVYPKVSGALCANSHPGSYTGQDAFNDMLPVISTDKQHRKYIVRRLTPIECARLQGMPDDWCEGLGGSDSAIYKAYGNGLALPCAFDVLNRIARFAEQEAREWST